MDDLAQIIANLQSRLIENERRLETSFRDGTVAEVDIDNLRLKANLGTDKEPMITGWIPWVERGGSQGTFSTPAVGEPLSVNAPNGEMALARATLGGLSANFASPSKEAGAKVIKSGSSELTMRDSGIVADTPKIELGNAGGKPVARIGDMIEITTGSSAGRWPIVEGSSKVFAAD